jgi:hypothetical protein
MTKEAKAVAIQEKMTGPRQRLFWRGKIEIANRTENIEAGNLSEAGLAPNLASIG